jgi:hypothetical protein
MPRLQASDLHLWRFEMKAAFLTLFFVLFGTSPARADSLFNLAGSVHGFGDVVGPYLLAKQAARHENLYLLIDDRAEKVLKTYLELGEKPLASTARMTFVRATDLPHLPPLDRFYETFRGARKGPSTTEIESQLTTRPKITLITHDLHSPYGRESLPVNMKVSGWSEVRTADRTFYFSAAGLGSKRNGILDDDSILPFQNKTLEQQREIAAERFSPTSVVAKILRADVFSGAKLSFAYGVHNESFNEGAWRGYPGQLASYSRGLETIAAKNQTPVLVFSPNTKDVLQSTLGVSERTTVLSLEELANLKTLSTDRVYLVSTGALSSSQFVALTAASDLPYMIEGDSALSAAVRLAKPFVMLKGPWGLFGIDGLSLALTESGAPWAKSVYPIRQTPGDDTPDFSNLEEIAKDSEAFTRLGKNAQSWSERIEWILAYAEGRVPRSQLLAKIPDPLLRASLTQQGESSLLEMIRLKNQIGSCRSAF